MYLIVARAIDIMALHNHDLSAHAQRVACLVSKVLEKRPELANGFATDAIVVAALMHDIGKINWPKKWFSAPFSALTDAEVKAMQLHPIQGANLARQMGASDNVAKLIAEHHERSGGRGYPRSITHPHPASLVISTCDAYAACREHRAYREKSLSVADALREADRVGCPEAVKALEYLARGRYYLEQHCS